ncbi:hypothetical protein BKA69DRAFT_460272 [Paraphysoderma sedebokerense]|nr:hypothetical protein BKA69DRAFT_460272 [Paraphysoderma sedebokerense]
MLSTKPVSTRNDYPLSNLFTYATSVNPNLLCGICSEPLYDPIELECEHYFCRTCLTSWIENQKDSDGDVSAEEYMVVCPLDKTPHSFSKPHKPIARLIAAQLNELIVKCNSCGIPMQRHLFEKHYENDCEFKVITCEKEGCGESYVRREKDMHARSCDQKCKKEVRFQLPEYSNSSTSSRKLEKQKAHSSPARSNSLPGRTSQSSSDSKFNASKEPSYQLGFFYEYYQGDFDEIPRFTELTPNV